MHPLMTIELAHQRQQELRAQAARSRIAREARKRQLRRFLQHAHERDASPRLLSILADSAQPDIARQRAFGRVVAELDNPPTPTTAEPPSVDAA